MTTDLTERGLGTSYPVHPVHPCSISPPSLCPLWLIFSPSSRLPCHAVAPTGEGGCALCESHSPGSPNGSTGIKVKGLAIVVFPKRLSSCASPIPHWRACALPPFVPLCPCAFVPSRPGEILLFFRKASVYSKCHFPSRRLRCPTSRSWYRTINSAVSSMVHSQFFLLSHLSSRSFACFAKVNGSSGLPLAKIAKDAKRSGFAGTGVNGGGTFLSPTTP